MSRASSFVIGALMADLRAVDYGFRSQTEREIDALVRANAVRRTADTLAFWTQQVRAVEGGPAAMVRSTWWAWSRAWDMHEEAKGER